jgi:DNA-binding IclR family transcriptional regulator
VPIWGASNRVNYAISVSGPTQRIDDRLDDIVASLKRAAAAISLANKGTAA